MKNIRELVHSEHFSVRSEGGGIWGGGKTPSQPTIGSGKSHKLPQLGLGWSPSSWRFFMFCGAIKNTLGHKNVWSWQLLEFCMQIIGGGCPGWMWAHGQNIGQLEPLGPNEVDAYANHAIFYHAQEPICMQYYTSLMKQKIWNYCIWSKKL